MKLSKNLGRIATTFLATAMLASVSAVPAFAAGVTSAGTDQETGAKVSITEIDLTKTITTDGKTPQPDTTFTIDVEPGSATTFEDGTLTSDQQPNIVSAKPGVKGGVTGTILKSTPAESASESYTLNGALTVNVSAFANEQPGVYHYVVSENATNPYEGIKYDETKYDLYVYLMRDEDHDNALYIGYAVCVKRTGENPAATDDKSELTFTNDYGQNNNTVHSVTVTKELKGDAAVLTDTFDFTVSVSPREGDPTNELYQVVYQPLTGSAVTDYVKSGATITVTGIGNNGTITINGLTANDVYTVTEIDSKGYIVSDDDNDSAAGTVNGSVSTENGTATITNTKDAVTPTGIVMDIAPYVLLVVVAAAGCFVFLRKRRED